MMGVKAVDLLLEGKSKRVVAMKNGALVDYDIEEALAMQKTIDPEWIKASKLLTR